MSTTLSLLVKFVTENIISSSNEEDMINIANDIYSVIKEAVGSHRDTFIIDEDDEVSLIHDTACLLVYHDMAIENAVTKLIKEDYTLTRKEIKQFDIYFACPTGVRRDNLIVGEYGSKFGACLTRDTFNMKTLNRMAYYFLDNGAFSDYKLNKPFNAKKFVNRLIQITEKVASGEFNKEPRFVVIPDIVMGGMDSLSYSLQWLEYLKRFFPQFKYFLAVQDGMESSAVEAIAQSGDIDGIFLGGSKEFKYRESAHYASMANFYGLGAHAGGIGNRRSILSMKLSKWHSVDSGVAMLNSSVLHQVLAMKPENELLWSV